MINVDTPEINISNARLVLNASEGPPLFPKSPEEIEINNWQPGPTFWLENNGRNPVGEQNEGNRETETSNQNWEVWQGLSRDLLTDAINETPENFRSSEDLRQYLIDQANQHQRLGETGWQNHPGETNIDIVSAQMSLSLPGQAGNEQDLVHKTKIDKAANAWGQLNLEDETVDAEFAEPPAKKEATGDDPVFDGDTGKPISPENTDMIKQTLGEMNPTDLLQLNPGQNTEQMQMVKQQLGELVPLVDSDTATQLEGLAQKDSLTKSANRFIIDRSGNVVYKLYSHGKSDPNSGGKHVKGSAQVFVDIGSMFISGFGVIGFAVRCMDIVPIVAGDRVGGSFEGTGAGVTNRLRR
jgi:hypothetical protein